ncbi:MAG: hypothetical protein ACYDCN_01075 [Bacteroidia bacterium]
MQKAVTKKVLEQSLTNADKKIRFTHHDKSFNLKRVCTYVSIYYDDSKTPEQEFFIENQLLTISNVFEMCLFEKKKSITITLSKIDKEYDLEKLKVEILR